MITMATNLETIYDALTVWFSRLDGVESVSVGISELGLLIHASFINENKDTNHQQMTVSKFITRAHMEQLSSDSLDEMEKLIMDEFQRQHMLWEVGEE